MWCNGSTRRLGRWGAVQIGHLGPLCVFAHSLSFFSFEEESTINFFLLDLLNLIGNTVTLGEPPRGVTGYVVEGTGYIANTLRC